MRTAKFDPLDPPHYGPMGQDAYEIAAEVETELDLIAEGQEAAEHYNAKQVRDLQKWFAIAKKVLK